METNILKNTKQNNNYKQTKNNKKQATNMTGIFLGFLNGHFTALPPKLL